MSSNGIDQKQRYTLAGASADLVGKLMSQRDSIRNLGARFVQMEFADINGYVRGKISGLDKSLEASGTGVSTLIEAVIGGDNIVMTPFSNFENSFPKMVAVPDPDTVVHWSWQPDMGAVICDVYMEDGTPCPYDPRQILKAVLKKYDELGVVAKTTLEYEFYVFHDDPRLLSEQRFSELVPFGRTWDFYSVARSPHFGNLAREFLGRMEDIKIDIEAFHTEYGFGMYEYAHGLAEPLAAADAAVRGKLYLKQLCTERGLLASYMSQLGLNPSNSSSGAHHNVSIWRDGKNLLWNGTDGLTDTARHFAAGILESLADLHLIFRPWVNSYRRMDRTQWNPENASWGLDNHTVAMRVIHGGVPAKHSRFEHRVAGADVNPYLTLAAILLAGLRGIERRLEPPPYVEGDAGLDANAAALPRSLEASIQRFKASPIARELFGDGFVDHLSAVKQEEWEAFKAAGLDHKWDEGVTDWERDRYLTWV